MKLFEAVKDLWFGVTNGAPDLAGAMAKYKLSTDMGRAGAQNYLEVAHRHGSGAERNETEAVRLYTLSARADNAEEQSNLGACYFLVVVVKRDHVHAHHLYKYAEHVGAKRK